MKTLAAILAVLALSVIAATAEDTPRRTLIPGAAVPKTLEDFFKEKDTNGDGKLFKEEYIKGSKDAAKAEERFTTLDKDKDGFLSLEEFKAGGYPRRTLLPPAPAK